jgi:YesN/AraC family two-component response regulator
MQSDAHSLSDVTSRRAKELSARIQKSDVFRDYQQAFESLTGLPLSIRPVGAFNAPMHGSKHVNGFCRLMASKNKSCAACLELQQRIEDASKLRAATMQCFAGLSESAVPIRAGQEVIGYLQTGQVMLQKPSIPKFSSISKQLIEWGYGSDLAALQEAYLDTRQMSQAQYQSILRLLTIFADHLSNISNQLVLVQDAAESPVIARARAFIAEHKQEELSLAMVAKVVNMSPFYFCKTFRKETGITFTDYLARARVEAVKKLMLNPHKRISEAAYEAGFQSLSQFNRIFRRIAGESPSDFRERIHAPSCMGANSRLKHAA